MVEDNPGDLRLLREILDYVGVEYEQKVARDGDEAISVLSSSSWKPDIVFIDLNLPGKSGWEVLEFMHSHKGLNSIPSIIITGSLDEVDRKRADDLGADLAIEKYQDMSGFDRAVELVKEIVEKHSPAILT
jgi:CheY-like chemotaxis protein